MLFRSVTGHPIPTVIAPRRAGDPARLVASSEKAKAELGWEPQYTSLEKMIGSEWRWFQENPEGYKGR